MLRLQPLLVLLFISIFLIPASSIRSFPSGSKSIRSINSTPKFDDGSVLQLQMVVVEEYNEAPEYRNGPLCPVSKIHIAMTLDSHYLRGSIAAVHSVLKHATCPENVYFHFIASDSDSAGLSELTRTVNFTFPSLPFKVYSFREDLVKNLISPSIRQALENPLNYARTYLADIIDPTVDRVIYLDSDVVVVDDIQKLWSIQLSGSRAIGAPEYCHANFTNYFTGEFWSDRELYKVFEGKRACYFNTGVMVMDLSRWRVGGYRVRIENWMEMQKQRKIYDLGSLPPYLLVFGGEVEPIDHRWNQHGLGGNNVVNSCRSLHPGPVSLLHWSGKGKPWVRLDAGSPCPVDHLWAPYDLHRHQEQQEHPESL